MKTNITITNKIIFGVGTKRLILGLNARIPSIQRMITNHARIE